MSGVFSTPLPNKSKCCFFLDVIKSNAYKKGLCEGFKKGLEKLQLTIPTLKSGSQHIQLQYYRNIQKVRYSTCPKINAICF